MSREKALDVIRSHVDEPTASVGFILGSGLGQLANSVDGESIEYSDLPGFPQTAVSGHNPKLVIGKLEGVDIAMLSGRQHFYEEGRADVMREPLEVLADLGVKTLFVTNAGGSLNSEIPPGNLMLLKDHINYSGTNPLIGEPTDARFVNMTDAYDTILRQQLSEIAAKLGVAIKEGVYVWYSGPSFETPAEIRMFKLMGADAVGMSTVPEIILGRFLGMKCCAVSVITNMAAGIGDSYISHEQTKANAPIGAVKLETLIRTYLRNISENNSKKTISFRWDEWDLNSADDVIDED